MKIVKELKYSVIQKMSIFTKISENDILYHRKQRLYREAIFRETRFDIFGTLPDFYIETLGLRQKSEIIEIGVGCNNEIDFLRTLVY
jgi:hypothetical protein